MSENKILIYAFTLRRDVASALLLKRYLENRGAQAVLVTGYNIEFYAKYWRPDAIIINTISKIDYIKQICEKAKIIFWPGEGSEPDLTSNARMLSERKGLFDKLDLILAWGQHDLNLFGKYFKEGLEKIQVCGNPRLDLLKLNKNLQAKSAEKKSVGFIGRYNSLNHYDGRPTIYTLNHTRNLDSVIGQVRGYVLMVETIKYLVKNSDLKISIRPHPLEAPENYKYLQSFFPGRIHVDDSIDLANWIANQSIICSPSSTSFLEAYLTKTFVINLDQMTNLMEWVKTNQSFTAMSVEAGTAPKKLEEIKKLIFSPPKVKKSARIEEHLLEAHGWKLESTACSLAAAKILPTRSSKKPGRFWLKVLNYVNLLRFRYHNYKKPEFSNFNYCDGFHSAPKHFSKIYRLIDEESQNSISETL